MTGASFAGELKSVASYIDVAANMNGIEKALMVARALGEVGTARCLAGINMLEIGPGGGSSINSLIDGTELPRGTRIDLSLVEMDGISSTALDRARGRFEEKYGGSTTMIRGDACRLSDFVPEDSQDIVVGSAVLHEIYSYSERGYNGLHSAMSSIAKVLRPGGFFAYRDVFPVDYPSLHHNSYHSYNPEGWTRFIKLFTPYYLDHATHPYHHNEDLLDLRQDSHPVRLEDLDVNGDLMVHGPVGLFREIQRHYITLRDHVWRSGILGFEPVLEGPKAYDWLDVKNGHKRVHFNIKEDNQFLTDNEKGLLTALSEREGDELIIDGDIFDEVTESGMNKFFMALEQGDFHATAVWEQWRKREGSETYAYMTLDQLIGTMAIKSAENGNGFLLLPISPLDVVRAPRNYYNRLINRVLPNPLWDGKQLVLFRNVSLGDSESVKSGLEVAQEYCSRSTLAALYSLVTRSSNYTPPAKKPVSASESLGEADLISRQLQTEISRIDTKGKFNVDTAIRMFMVSSALEAARDPRLETQVDETGQAMYLARLGDWTNHTNDKRGELTIRYIDGKFNGIRFDLTPFGDKQYHLYPNGLLVRIEDGKDLPINPINMRLLQKRLRKLQVGFYDPAMQDPSHPIHRND